MSNDELRDMAERIVEHHVIMNAYLLVTDLLRLETEIGNVSWDNMENLLITDEEVALKRGYASLEKMQDEGADQQEALEWWFVSGWLYWRLRDRGEMVLDSDYGRLWGRGTSGQRIAMDSIMEDLAKKSLGRNTP